MLKKGIPFSHYLSYEIKWIFDICWRYKTMAGDVILLCSLLIGTEHSNSLAGYRYVLKNQTKNFASLMKSHKQI